MARIKEEEFKKIQTTVEHFALPGHGGWPITVDHDHYPIIKKYLATWLVIENNGIYEPKRDAKPLVSLAKNGKMPAYVEMMMYKALYNDYNKLYNDLASKVEKIAKEL